MNADKKALWWRIAGLAVITALLTWATIRYVGPLTRLIGDTARFADYLKSFGAWGALVFVGFQAIQVVIAPIPGEVTQFAAGFVYGTVWGTILALVGTVVGSAIALAIARLFGFPLLKILLPASALDKFSFLINKPKAELVMLILFLVPGAPKDVLTYIGGLTPVKPLRFLITATVARFPGILLSAFIGAHVEEHKYVQVIVASCLALGVFVAGVLFQDRIVRRMQR